MSSGPTGTSFTTHVPGGCHGPSPQVRKPQGPGRRGQAGSGQASLVPEARSWHLTVWGAQGSFLLGNWLLGRCRPARPPPGLDEEGPRVGQARTHLASFLHGRASQPATRLSAHPPWEHSPVLSWDWAGGGGGEQSPSAEIGGGGCSRQLGPPTPSQAPPIPRFLLRTQVPGQQGPHFFPQAATGPPKEGRGHSRLQGGWTPVPAELSQCAQINCVSAQ